MEDEVPCIGAISSITQIANMKFSACILNNKMFLTTLTTLNSKQAEYAATVMHILGHLGGIDMVNELNGDKVHRLENVMTITLGAHSLFDALFMWFEPTVCSWLVQLAKVVHFAYHIRTFRTHTTYVRLSQD